jgi:hypothetical protein
MCTEHCFASPKSGANECATLSSTHANEMTDVEPSVSAGPKTTLESF